MRWHLLAAAAATLTWACSSSTTLGNGGSSGSSGSSGGGGGGASSVDCGSACAHIAAAGCASPTPSECLSTCQQGAQACPSQMTAAVACMENQRVFCDGAGAANVVGCDAQQAALIQCKGGTGSSSGSTGGGSSGSGSGSTSSSSGGAIPAGGSCAQNPDGCVPITCSCNDGYTYGPIGFCVNDVCQGASDGCPSLCSNNAGWSGH